MVLCFALLAMADLAQAREKGLNLFAFPREAPADEIYSSTGQKVKLSDFKGDFVIAVFWSKTCLPCIRELDDLSNFVKKTAGTGIKVMLISNENEWKDLDEQRKFLVKYRAPNVDFYVDPNGRLAGDFGIFASPHTVLINTKGEEIGRIRGSQDWDDEDVIEQIYKIKAQHG